MSKAKGKKKKTSNPRRSFYDLSEVSQKINSGEVVINPDVIHDAQKDFGWGINDILDVYRMLQPKHFYKIGTLNVKPSIGVDIYKIHTRGEHIYTHFYINDFDKLVINSFKQK